MKKTDDMSTAELRQAALSAPGVKLLKSKTRRRMEAGKRVRETWDVIAYQPPGGKRPHFITFSWTRRGGCGDASPFVTRAEAEAQFNLCGRIPCDLPPPLKG